MYEKCWIVAAGCAMPVGLGTWRAMRFYQEVEESVYEDPKTPVLSDSLAFARAQHTLVATPALVDSSIEWQGRLYPIVETWIEREVKRGRPTGRYFLLLRLRVSSPGDSLLPPSPLGTGAELEYAPRRFISGSLGSLWFGQLSPPFPDTLRLRAVPRDASGVERGSP
jgi:hypothetical protein